MTAGKILDSRLGSGFLLCSTSCIHAVVHGNARLPALDHTLAEQEPESSMIPTPEARGSYQARSVMTAELSGVVLPGR